jgi:cell wall-associated NlpC family hydrolase
MNATEATQYIGLPWKFGENGPDAYDCWGLLRHVMMFHFNTYMPEAPIGDAEGCASMFTENVVSGNWVPIDKPEHGAGVLLRGGRLPHVGIYLDIDGGGILHSLEGWGVIFSRPSSLNGIGFGRASYYRIIKK